MREKLELFLLERSLAAFTKLEAKLRRRAEKIRLIIQREQDAVAAAKAAVAALESRAAARASVLSSHADRAERVAGNIGSLVS